MKSFWNLIRAAFVGGLLFLVPLVLFLVVIQKALNLLRKLVDPIVQLFPFDSVLGLPMARIIGLVIIFILCVVTGFLAKTNIATRIKHFVETNILMKIPGYEFYKRMGESMIGVEGDNSRQVVLAYIEEAWQIAFLMEKMEKDISAVFVPSAPTPWSGSVYYLTPERVRVTDISYSDALKILKQMGAGGQELLRKYL